MLEFIQDLDLQILNAIHEDMSCGFLDAAMPVITSLGNAGLIFFAAAGLMLFFRAYRRCGVNILLVMAAGAVIANLLLKPLIARERPCWLNEEVQLLIAVPQDFSFPSGHTLHAFAVAAVIFAYDRRIGIPALIFAAVMGFSRLYLYVHFPSDVLCGALLGIALAAGGYFLLRHITKKFPRLAELLPEREKR